LKASIIIVNYNGEGYLKDCFDALLSQSVNDFEIVFVDNNSQDKSLELLKSSYSDKRIKVIRSDTNLGFAGGNNLGYKHASGEYVILLNNDTVVEKNWLKVLLETIEADSTAGMAQSLVITEGVPDLYYRKNGTINLLGHNIMLVFPIDTGGTGEIFQANGCSLIIKRGLADKLNGLFLDEYFAYAEDTFLSFKVKFAGYRILHNSNSIVRHKGGGTSKKQKASFLYFYQERNRLLNFFLFFSKSFLVRYIPYLTFNFALKAGASVFTSKYSFTGLFKAYWWLISHYTWIKKQREALANIKNVNERAVLSYISCKLFNGDNVAEKFINFLSLLYCRLFMLNVIEVNKNAGKV
jgi:GT2 family glycosyltransferase